MYDQIHTTRKTFKRENFNMKNIENAFSSFEQVGYLSLHIGCNGDLVEVFRLFWEFQVKFHLYLDIGRHDDDD